MTVSLAKTLLEGDWKLGYRNMLKPQMKSLTRENWSHTHFFKEVSWCDQGWCSYSFSLEILTKKYLQKGFVDLGIPILLREGNNSRLILVSPKDSPSYQSFIDQYPGKLRGCLVLLFKQQFSMFKHYNTYFHNTF